jgi:hypothetical protein
MVEFNDAVIVGRTVGVDVGYPFSGSIESHFGGTVDPPPPGHPKAGIGTPDGSGGIGPVGSWYSVEVLQVLRGPLQAGDIITVTQLGGVVDSVLWEAEDDPLMRVPATYILFLDNPMVDIFTGSPIGRFEVGAGGQVQPVAAKYWGRLPAVAELNGKPVEAAAARITAAAAQLSAATPAP